MNITCKDNTARTAGPSAQVYGLFVAFLTTMLRSTVASILLGILAIQASASMLHQIYAYVQLNICVPRLLYYNRACRATTMGEQCSQPGHMDERGSRWHRGFRCGNGKDEHRRSYPRGEKW